MINKKIMVLAILLVSLFAISAVSAADNQTDDIASTDLTTNDVSSLDSLKTEDIVYSDDNVTAGQEVLASSDLDDVISLDNDDVLHSPGHNRYSVNVYDTTIDYSTGGKVIIYITPYSGDDYAYDFYFRVYDSSGSNVINTNLYSYSSTSQTSYTIDAYKLSPGTYTMKIINYADSYLMSSAKLFIKNPYNPSSNDYGVSIYDTSIDYGNAGYIYMYINPCTYENYYKYNFYLNVYNSMESQVINQHYSSRDDDSYCTYYLDSYGLEPGTYTVEIVNYYDSQIMATATLSIVNDVNLYDCSYNSLVSAINNAYNNPTINLFDDILFDSSASSITISNKLTIDGNGHIIDADSNSRIFLIKKDAVVLKNIIFKNAYQSTANGAAVYCSGSYCKLINCTFINSFGSNGAAVYWTGSSGEIMNCTFIDNVAQGDYSGGAIYLSGSEANLVGCKFINNTAYNGGAVYLSGSYGEISDCDFISNSADYQGGALYLNIYSTISDSNFESNSADYGGAIAMGDSYCNVINSNFNNNVAENGSAIKWYSSVGDVTNCTFNGAKTYTHRYMYLSEKYTPYFYIYAGDINLGENLNLTISWSQDLQGNMSIDIFSERMNKTVFNTVKQLDGSYNEFMIPISNLKSGNHVIDVFYSGDNLFKNRTISDEFTVFGKPSDIFFTVQNITWGTPIVLNPTVTAGATGLIEIWVNDEYVDEFAVGTTYKLFNVGGPSSKITLVYLGDDNYMPCQYTQRAYVERLNTSINIPDKIVSGISTFPIIFNEDAGGYVTVKLDGITRQGYLENGTFTFDTYESKVRAGIHDLYVQYSGDGKYNPLTETYEVNVEIQIPTLELNVANAQQGSYVKIRPYIHGATGNYVIYVDGSFKKRIYTTDSVDYYEYLASELGKHEVTVHYSGDSYYASVENSTTFRVYLFYPIEAYDTQIIYNTDNYLQAKFYDEYGSPLEKKYVIFNVNGTDYYRVTDVDGTAILDEKFDIGLYDVYVINPIVNERKLVKLTVFTSIIAEDMTRYYNSGYDFNATFLDIDAKPLGNAIVVFDVNGELYRAETDGKGYAKLVVPLPVGEYVVKSINTKTDEETTNLLSITTSIESEDMSRAYNSTMDYKATFYDTDGYYLANQTVTFEVGGRQYNVITDLAGQAILNVGLAKGEYNITSINTATNQRSTNRLTILERIINNNDVIVFGSEEAYYSVRVIDNDAVVCKAGEVVEFRLNGMTYNIQTASNGYASLKITEPAGIHTVYAKYKGYTVENQIIVLGDIPSILNLSVSNINYGQKETVTTNVSPEYLNGNVTIYVKGANGYEKIFALKASQSIVCELDNLNASTYQVTAVFTDFDSLSFAKAVKTFVVAKATPDIVVTAEGMPYGENSTITVNIQKASGNVTIKVGDRTFNEYVITNGVIIKRISDLAAGNYTVNVDYAGNNNFNKVSKSASFEVARGSVELNLDVASYSFGQDIIAKVSSTYDGEVTLKIGSTTKTVNVMANTQNSINFGKLNAGKYMIKADLSPSDNNYEAASANASFEVLKANVNVNIKAENIELDQATKITVTVTDGVTGNIKLQLNDKEYSQPISNSKAIFNITGLAAGDYNAKAIFDGTTNYNAASNTASFKVTGVTVKSLIIPSAVSNNDYKYALDLPADAGGNLTVTINGKDYTSKVINGQATVDLPKLADGDYQYTLKYSGDSRYAGFTTKNTIKVAKVTVKTGDATIAYGSGYDYKATFTNDDGTPLANSDVSFVVNGKVFNTKTDSNGVAKLNVGLGDGVYTISSTNLKTGENTINTLKIVGGTNATILSAPGITVVYNDGKNLTVSLKDIFDRPMASTPISVNLTGTPTVVFTDANGQVNVSTKGLTPKTYNVGIKFAGNNKYTASSTVAKVVVNKLKANINVKAENINSNQATKITVTVSKGITGNIKLQLNNKEYSQSISNSKAIFNITGLETGQYTAKAIFAGNSVYDVASATATFRVIGIDVNNVIIPSAVSNNDYKYALDLPADASGNVTVTIDGKDYTSKVSNGQATVNLPKLADGNYQYTVKYSGNSKYNGFSSTNTLKIAKATVKSGDATIAYGGDYDYKTTFTNNDGTPLANTEVSFIINGKTFNTKTDSNGVAKLNVGLGNGVYKIVCVNSKTGENAASTVKIIGGTNATILSASKLSTVYNSGKNLVVTLKDIFDRPVANVPISVNITGSVKVVYTDANGQAKVSTKGLVPKTYNPTLTFAGDSKYTASSTVAKIVVSKAKVKLSASKKTFNVNVKTKKYTVTLKNNKGKIMKKTKLQIKVGGKTYKATTNSKGKATFKITQLTKKGKYQAVVKYSGSKNFKALNKKVVITVK